MKAYSGSGGTAPLILNLGTRWTHQLLYHRERVAGSPSTRGCVSSKAHLNDLGKIYLAPAWIRSLTRPARSLFGTMSTPFRLPNGSVLKIFMTRQVIPYILYIQCIYTVINIIYVSTNALAICTMYVFYIQQVHLLV